QRGVVTGGQVGAPGVGHGDEGVDPAGLHLDAIVACVPGDGRRDRPSTQLRERPSLGRVASADVAAAGADHPCAPASQRESNLERNTLGTSRNLADHPGARIPLLAGIVGIRGALTDTPGYLIVELGGIEPPSARWSPNLLRPFPTSQLTAAEPAGR